MNIFSSIEGQMMHIGVKWRLNCISRDLFEKRTQPVLMVVDGTWSQALEIANNSRPFFSQFATCVSLGSEVESQGGRPCEYTTLEAIAKALNILEPDGGGMVVETMMMVRRAMVGRVPGEPSNSKSRPKMKKNKGKGVD